MATEKRASGPRGLADGVEIRPARLDDLDELLPLMRAYCDFYESSPSDEGVLTMMRTLIEDPGLAKFAGERCAEFILYYSPGQGGQILVLIGANDEHRARC